MSKPKHTAYVVGFLFDRAGERVALINKQRPAWQAGKWNGIGGKIETDLEEEPLDAMRREFAEETAVEILEWEEIGLLTGKEEESGTGLAGTFAVHCFRAFADMDTLDAMQRTTDEPLEIFGVDAARALTAATPHLVWMLPYALQSQQRYFTIEYGPRVTFRETLGSEARRHYDACAYEYAHEDGALFSTGEIIEAALTELARFEEYTGMSVLDWLEEEKMNRARAFARGERVPLPGGNVLVKRDVNTTGSEL